MTFSEGQRRLLAGVFALVAAALPLARSFPLPGVSVADLALAFATLAVAACFMAARSWPRPPAWLLPAAMLVLCSAVSGGLLVALGSPLPFSAEELLKSLAKLGFYVVAAGALSCVVLNLEGHTWREILLWALALHALVGLYVYLAMHTDFLPFRDFWTEAQRAEEMANAARFGIFAVRLRGFAAEPANLGYFLALGLAAVLLNGRWPRRRPWRELAVVAALVLTLSLSAYALAAAGALLILVARRRNLDSLVRGLGVAAVLALLLAAFVPPLRRGFEVAVIDRVAGIVAGSSNPAETKRLVGSWAAAGMMVEASPWLGAGLGNYDVALDELIARIDPRLGMTADDQGWNVPAYVLGTLGWPGLLVLALLYVAAIRASWAGGLLLLVAGFADGTLLGAPFWVFYVLLTRAPSPLPAPRRASSSSSVNSSAAPASPSQAIAGRV